MHVTGIYLRSAAQSYDVLNNGERKWCIFYSKNFQLTDCLRLNRWNMYTVEEIVTGIVGVVLGGRGGGIWP